MELLIIFIVWYAFGLLGSTIAIKSQKLFSWDEDWLIAITTALFGPLNLIGCILFVMIEGDDK